MSDDYEWIEKMPPKWFSPDIIREICDTFVVRDEDTYMVTYPKSGTNWLTEIVCLIHSKGDPTWVKSLPVEERAPWIEVGEYSRTLKNKKNPRLITSHLPVQLFPKSFFSSKAKVIYLLRNPRDVLVSRYYFWLAINYVNKPESLEELFKDFMHGNVPYGSWFQHTRGWLSLRDRDNILLLSYEELKKDARSAIKRICEFLGKTLEPRELDLVVKNSSFQVMKENKQSENSTVHHEIIKHFIMRKGIVGDWKDHFTVAQAEEFDKAFQEKMADFPKELFPWE